MSALRLLGLALVVSSLAACTAKSGDAVGSSSANETEASATVTFSAGDWTPTWSGTVAAGGTLKVDYDFDRLPQCRNSNRIDSWVVEADYRFDGGKVHTMALPGSPGAGETDDTIEIPEGAKTLELWFENHAVGGDSDSCAAYDSQYGANYQHDIE